MYLIIYSADFDHVKDDHLEYVMTIFITEDQYQLKKYHNVQLIPMVK